MSNEATWLSYCLELRSRLLRAFLVIAVIFAGMLFFSNDLYQWLAQPLLNHLPEHSQLIAIGITSPLLTPLKFAFYCALFVSTPLLLYELWAFVAPALYQHERQLIAPLLLVSILLFVAGVLFAYFVVFPLLFKFFIASAPKNVLFTPDIAHYLSFTMQLFFAFGFAFQVPIAIFLVVALNITTCETLGKIRPYIIIAAFVIGMLLTPPDVLSQILLAIPLWVLFEIGLLASKLFIRKRVQTVNML